MIVLDASALLALLHRESGWEVVAHAVAKDSATLSAVNYAEVVQKAAQHGFAAKMSTPPWKLSASPSARSAAWTPDSQRRSTGIART